MLQFLRTGKLSVVPKIWKQKTELQIAAYACTNPTGTKVPMAIIYKTKNPRFFRIGSLPVHDFSQRHAWSDCVTFSRWFYNIFVPFIRLITSKNVALLRRLYRLRGNDVLDPEEKIHIMKLPPNSIVLHKPVSLGCIAAWKAKYRIIILRSIVHNGQKLSKNERTQEYTPKKTAWSEKFPSTQQLLISETFE